MLLLIWWMYDGYAWLTNAIPTERVRYRLTLIGGMGGFLVIALAIPDAYDGDRPRVRARLPRRGPAARAHVREGDVGLGGRARFSASCPSTSSARAPARRRRAGRRRRSGRSGRWRPLCSGSRRISRPPRASRSRRRTSSSGTGSSIIIALGESIVVIGAGAPGLAARRRALARRAALAGAQRGPVVAVLQRRGARSSARYGRRSARRRPELALSAFGYWHYGLLLGIVALAAGLKKAVGDPYDTLDGWIAVELGGGRRALHGLRRRFPPPLGIPAGG